MLALLRFIFIVMCFATPTYGQLVQLKFWLKDKADSTYIHPESVAPKPRISHRAYHNNKAGHNKLFVQTCNIQYDSSDHSFLFTYDKQYYHYGDIFLEVGSSDYYYSRDSDGDYDESDCLNLTKLPHATFYLSPFNSWIIKEGNLNLSPTDCMTLTLKCLTEKGDTILCSPPKREIEDTIRRPSYLNGAYMGIGMVTTSSSLCYLNERITLFFETRYFLEVALYHGLDCHYTIYPLPSHGHATQTLFLNQRPYTYQRLDEPVGKCDNDARTMNCFSEEEVLKAIEEAKMEW